MPIDCASYQLQGTGIKVGKDNYLNVLLHADDQTIIQKNEGDMQLSLCKLNQFAKSYGLSI